MSFKLELLRATGPNGVLVQAAGMTLGIALTWEVVIAAEMIASDSGLGRLAWEGYVSSTPAVIVIGMISIGVAGYISTLVVSGMERKLMPWAEDK